MIDAIARQLKALAHPQRLRLFTLIRAQCFCCYPAESSAEPAAQVAGGKAAPAGACVGDLACECDIAPSTVSHHLKELRTAGLIDVERRGQFIYCRAREDVLAGIVRFLSAVPDGVDLMRGTAGEGEKS